MDTENDIFANQGSGIIDYMAWYDHVKFFFISRSKELLIYFVASFGVFWGIIEAASFFYPPANKLGNKNVLIGLVLFCVIGSLGRCLYNYCNAVPVGLEGESSRGHAIARKKKMYWEFALACELIQNKIEAIDNRMNKILTMRVHTTIKKKLDTGAYIEWLEMRTPNILRMLDVCKNLYISDLFEKITAEKNEIYVYQLLEVINLIEEHYRALQDYVTEGMEVMVPEGFESIHTIQFEWITVFQDGMSQLLELLHSISVRDKTNSSIIESTIKFKELPKIDEFRRECNKMKSRWIKNN